METNRGTVSDRSEIRKQYVGHFVKISPFLHFSCNFLVYQKNVIFPDVLMSWKCVYQQSILPITCGFVIFDHQRFCHSRCFQLSKHPLHFMFKMFGNFQKAFCIISQKTVLRNKTKVFKTITSRLRLSAESPKKKPRRGSGVPKKET